QGAGYRREIFPYDQAGSNLRVFLRRSSTHDRQDYREMNMNRRQDMNDQKQQIDGDGIVRRGFLKCMAWVGTGVIWSVSSGGILSSRALGQDQTDVSQPGDFTFAQISDSHIGFSKEPNKDVARTLRIAIDKINALPARPDLLLHTGDLTHLSKPEEFDTVAQIVKVARVQQNFFVPGEHDVFSDDARLYLDRYGQGTR